MVLTKEEISTLKTAFKSCNQGFTNNQTFNDSTHSNSGNLQQTGYAQVFNEEETKPVYIFNWDTVWEVSLANAKELLNTVIKNKEFDLDSLGTRVDTKKVYPDVDITGNNFSTYFYPSIIQPGDLSPEQAEDMLKYLL